MAHAFNIQLQIDNNLHEVGGFDSASHAAAAAHVEATHFGTQSQPKDVTEADIVAGHKTIELRASDPRITVLVS